MTLYWCDYVAIDASVSWTLELRYRKFRRRRPWCNVTGSTVYRRISFKNTISLRLHLAAYDIHQFNSDLNYYVYIISSHVPEGSTMGNMNQCMCSGPLSSLR